MLKTDHALAGQMIMAGFEGTVADAALDALIREVMPGGLILFAKNVVDAEQLAALCQGAQHKAKTYGLPRLIIAIDQEGGVVARLKSPHFTEFSGNPAIRTPKDAKEFADACAADLSRVGIHMNMAPVMDVAPDDFDSIMQDRIFSHDPHTVATLGCEVIRCLQASGIMAVAKHFPGIGRTTLDSHIHLPVLDLSAQDLHDFELIPFKAAIAANVAGIMLSHIRYTGLDSTAPAGLSHPIVTDLLRKKMGYSNLIMTDDMNMGAISKHFSLTDAVIRFLYTGADMTLICQNPIQNDDDLEVAHAALTQRIAADPAARKYASDACNRILSVKAAYKI